MESVNFKALQACKCNTTQNQYLLLLKHPIVLINICLITLLNIFDRPNPYPKRYKWLFYVVERFPTIT